MRLSIGLAAGFITTLSFISSTYAADTTTLSKIAAASGLKVDQFVQCVKDKKFDQKIAADAAEAIKLGAQGTPFTVVQGPNGEVISVGGAYPAETWNSLFATLLKLNPTQPSILPTSTNLFTKPLPIDTTKETIWGNASGKLSLIVYTDFDCPFCKRLHNTLENLGNSELKWTYRNFPLETLHPTARLKANAVECAGEQGKYSDFVNQIFTYQDAIDVSEFTGTPPVIKENVPDAYYLRNLPYGAEIPTDQELVLVRGNGDNDTRTIIIPSVRKLFPKLKKYDLILQDFAAPNDSGDVFFRASHNDDEYQPHERFYKFDIKTKQLKAMKINNFYIPGKGPFALSPLEDRFYWIPVSKGGSARQLYVFDLIEDKRTLVVSLPAGQTFDTNNGEMLNYRNEVEWLDNNTLGYSIFSQSKKAKIAFDDEDWYKKLFIKHGLKKLPLKIRQS